MVIPADSQSSQAAARRESTGRLFLRAMLLSEHLVFLTAGSYSVWTTDQWKNLGLERIDTTSGLIAGVAISFFIALVLAAVALRCRWPIWAATLAGGVLGPVLGAGALWLILKTL